MNCFALTILFVVGCFGQQNVTDVPGGTSSTSPSTPIDTSITSPNVPQDNSDIERPCRAMDLYCIRRYFLHNSRCKKAPGRVPDPLLRPLSVEFYPGVNITEIDVNAHYNNLTGKIREFYINRQTDKLVVGIELQEFQKSSNDTFYRYHRRGREPIITHSATSVLFRSVYLTVTIPQEEDLRLDKSDSFAYVDELPRFTFSPSLGQSSDPSIPVKFASVAANLPSVVSEYMLTEAPFMAAAYIQHVICDFGLKLI